MLSTLRPPTALACQIFNQCTLFGCLGLVAKNTTDSSSKKMHKITAVNRRRCEKTNRSDEIILIMQRTARFSSSKCLCSQTTLMHYWHMHDAEPRDDNCVSTTLPMMLFGEGIRLAFVSPNWQHGSNCVICIDMDMHFIVVVYLDKLCLCCSLLFPNFHVRHNNCLYLEMFLHLSVVPHYPLNSLVEFSPISSKPRSYLIFHSTARRNML